MRARSRSVRICVADIGGTFGVLPGPRCRIVILSYVAPSNSPLLCMPAAVSSSAFAKGLGFFVAFFTVYLIYDTVGEGSRNLIGTCGQPTFGSCVRSPIHHRQYCRVHSWQSHKETLIGHRDDKRSTHEILRTVPRRVLQSFV